MPSGRKSGGSSRQSQAMPDARALAKAARARAQKIIKNSGKDIRQIRSEVSKLKKAGIVSPRIDARTYQPSRYMLSKLKQNADIIAGEVIAVKAPKKVREKYVEKGLFEARGSVLIVPKDAANQRARITRGLVETTRPLKYGEEVRIILPFKAADMEGVANRLKNDPTLDGMKNPDELFGFRLFGHNMATIGFPDADELADYILTRYAHLFSGKNGSAAVKQFVLFRFKSRDSQLADAPQSGKVYTPRKKREENTWSYDRRLKRDAARKKKERERETPEQRQNRLDKQRIRSAQNRQRKFDES